MTADAIGGVWQYSLELARGLGERGFSVLLAVMGGGVTDAQRAEVTRLPNARLEEMDCKLEWMHAPSDDVVASGAWLLALADEFRPTFVHLNGYAHAALPWKSPVIVVAHSCVLSWFEAVRRTAAPVEWDAYRNAVRQGLQAANLVIAPSRFMLRAIEFHYGELENTRVILNGRNPETFQPGPKEPFILCAGRVWDDAKNLQRLADAAGGVQWPIFAAGESKHPDGGSNEIAGLHLLGKLDSAALAGWYARAGIYASPAVYEPFGLTVLEAALSGCALVLSDIPSFREIWGGAACYVNPTDSQAWCNQLNALISDPIRRFNLAEAARGRGLELTAAKMTGEYLEAYQQAQTYRPCASHSSAIPFDPTGITETPIFSAA